MNPRIYKSNAAKQAEYRAAKKLGMTCAEYRAHIAAGGKPAPETEGNRGWDRLHEARARKADMEGSKTACHGCGYKKCACEFIAAHRTPTVTPPVPRHRTHIVSPKPDCAKYVTACGKFLEDVQVVDASNCSAAHVITIVTCKKCPPLGDQR
jgi:hypothetical protein